MPTGVSTSATITHLATTTASGPTVVYKTDQERSVRSYEVVAHAPSQRTANR